MAGSQSAGQRAALVVHVEPKSRDGRALRDAQARLEEAVGLTAAIHLDVVWAAIAPLARPVPATLLGSGKVEEISAQARALEPEIVMVNAAGTDSGADAAPPPKKPAAPPAGGGGGFRTLTIQGLPLLKPPYATISAINLDKGEIVWQVAHGDTPDNIRNNPALKGIDVPRTGQAGFNIGTLVTKNLVIAGDGQVTTTPEHPRGAPLRAYDQATGKEVGNVLLPAPQSGSPMTYMVNGKQYIIVAVSGGNYSGEYIAYTLPDNG